MIGAVLLALDVVWVYVMFDATWIRLTGKRWHQWAYDLGRSER